MFATLTIDLVRQAKADFRLAPGAPLIRAFRMSGIPESHCRVCPITASAETRSLTSTCDQGSGALVRRTRSPLHNLQLLSTQAGACDLRAPRSIPACAGARPATVSFCHDRVRGDARAFPSPHDRAGGGRSFRGDESRQRAFHKTAAPRRGRTEPIWQKRFYDFNVSSSEKRIEKLRYMHRNPVKRGLVTAPEDRKWSSFRAYACGEGGLVRVNCQEWPLTISYSPSRSHSFKNHE
jgi:hypothetical protein